MNKWLTTNPFRPLISLAVILLLVGSGAAQKQKKKGDAVAGTPVLWERINIDRQDLFLGPGGRQMQPDLSRITFIKQETGGYSRKFRIKDGAGRTWVAKIGKEAQSETAAVRLLAGIGYVTEINYLVPSLTIPGKGTFTNVRLEARPDGVRRGKEWKWEKNPFSRTPQLQGLKLMMAFINNWDTKNANNVILKKGDQRLYAVSDLGVSFGKTGSNSLPILWIIGRSRNKPTDYARSKFISGVKNGRVKVHFNGKNRGMMKFTTADARWLAERLTRLSDRQISDAFRAANYSDADVNLLTRAVKDRISQLVDAANQAGMARYR